MPMTKRVKRQWQVIAGVVIVIALVVAVLAFTHVSESVSGAVYAAKLERAIASADRIVVVEHSNWGDYASVPGSARIVSPPKVEYGRTELSAAAKTRFRDSVAHMDTTTQYMAAGCISRPHHTIEFYRGDTVDSRMEICFLCSVYEWDGSSLTPPQTMIEVLTTVVEDAGFRSDHDWDHWHDRAAENLAAQDSPTAP